MSSPSSPPSLPPPSSFPPPPLPASSLPFFLFVPLLRAYLWLAGIYFILWVKTQYSSYILGFWDSAALAVRRNSAMELGARGLWGQNPRGAAAAPAGGPLAQGLDGFVRAQPAAIPTAPSAPRHRPHGPADPEGDSSAEGHHLDAHGRISKSLPGSSDKYSKSRYCFSRGHSRSCGIKGFHPQGFEWQPVPIRGPGVSPAAEQSATRDGSRGLRSAPKRRSLGTAHPE